MTQIRKLLISSPKMRDFIRPNSVNPVCISIPNGHSGNTFKIGLWFVSKYFNEIFTISPKKTFDGAGGGGGETEKSFRIY